MSMTWLDKLRAEVDATSRGKAAQRLGVSRATVSMVLSGKYGADTRRIAAKVEAVLGQPTVECPHLGHVISLTACRHHHTASFPTNSPRAVAHWRACQNCHHKGAHTC